MRRLKATIKQLPVVGTLARWTNGALQRLLSRDASYWLNKVVPAQSACVVQIGSNDGKTNDPVYKLVRSRPGWSALLVEPVPYLFARLKENYGSEDRFRFVKAAVNNGENAIFYWVDESAKRDIPLLPAWYDQLGSFCRDHIVKHLGGVLAPYIRSTEVEGIRLPELLRQSGIRRIDILHIDAEGSDWTVLSQLELEKITPLAILYEHKHLSPEDKEQSLQFLAGRYDVFRLGDDFLAVNKDVDQAVHEALLPLQHSKVAAQFLAWDKPRSAA